MDLIRNKGDTGLRPATIRPHRAIRLQMPTLTQAARSLERPPPSGIDDDAYAVLRAVWHTFPRAGSSWRSVITLGPVPALHSRRSQAGQPLLDASAILWDATPLRQQHGRLLRILGTAGFARLEPLRSLTRRLLEPGGEPATLARLFFRAEANDNRPDILLGGYILQPFLYTFARRVLPGLNQDDWQADRCPVCGGGPYHAYLHPRSRQRILICGKCQCPWLAPRLRCPFCGNTRQDALGYCYQGQRAVERVDYCTRCRALLPVSPYPETGHPFALLDHLVTMPLRDAAERRGS